MVLSRGRLELANELGLTKAMLQPKVLSPHRISSPFNDDENEPLPPFSPHNAELEDVDMDEDLPPFTPEKTVGPSEERTNVHNTSNKYKYEPAKEQNNENRPSEWTSDAWRLCLELKKSKADLELAKELRRRQELVANARRHELMVSASKLRTSAIKNKQDKKLVKIATNRVIEHHDMLAHIEKQTKREYIQYIREHERTTRLLEKGQRRKWQKGPHFGPGPLPTDVFGDSPELPRDDFIYDIHGRRHDFTNADKVRGKSIFDSAMKKIQRVAAKAGRQLFHFFKKQDKDHNGVLDRKEFSATLQEMKIQLSTDQINALYDYFDRNGTGGIDYGEFMWSFFNRRAFLKKWEMKTEKFSRAELHAQFYQADKVSRGALTSREFFLAMNRLGFQFSSLDEAILHHQFDTNGDGFIDFEEFEEAFSKTDTTSKQELIPSKKKSVKVSDLEKELDALTSVQERLEKLLKQV
ncbi:hypothetical protein THRCLA_06938 [Thraustotheca clavata]|uniref:EF-hand domain-containing protein n=1 Tax=Thraustotheca clavata TaxID=74557 RepID=A0A1V9ZHK0_9STRA|nr:hypothetical protein THRCLA_06938 [Thraustotheca clavata]